MRSLTYITKKLFCNLNVRNRRFLRRTNTYKSDLQLHQKASKINQKKISQFISETPRQKIAYEMANKTKQNYDKELRDFIDKFNVKHNKKITLLDFSNYATDLGDLKDKPLRKQDIELIKEFQKRKIDRRVAQMKSQIFSRNSQKYPVYDQDDYQTILQGIQQTQKKAEEHQANIQKKKNQQNQKMLGEIEFRDDTDKEGDFIYQQGPYQIKDDFMILLFNTRSNTKVTTLNRIQSYKTLLFMGNGNGIISYAKGRGVNPLDSITKALQILKKNVIAIPRDSRCTLPLHIKKKHQDYRIYLRPVPGFNSHGHPLIAYMLTLAGIDHCGFHVQHTQKNVYNVLKVFYKAITLNTTPQQLAQRQGFKVYRHQFIRPLTWVRTHHPLANQASIRRYRSNHFRFINIMDSNK